MATFTMRLKDVLDITEDIGLNDYPIFEESHRETLNQKIVNRYWNSEIGMETISDFRRLVKSRMHEIMPLYNQYYESEKLKWDPFETVSMKTVTAGHSESGSTSEAKSRAVSSETPQHMLSANGDYATAAQDNISDTAADSMADESQESDVSGSSGPKSMLLMQLRETFLNLDVQIINDLADCFMLILSSGDEFTERSYNDYRYWL